MKRVACIGAGNVGRAWAIVFARAGYAVTLYDEDPSAVELRALPMIRRHLEDLATAGLLDDPAATERRISRATSLQDAVAGAVYVQESVKEDREVKAGLFAELDRCAPDDAIIASSTSAIPGSAFMEALAGRNRCLVAHPVNPPYLIPLVEICPTPWTSPGVVDRCYAFMTEVGQTPIRIKKELPGFILNRLQVALIGEALHLVGEGYCSVDDIDKTITAGLARRWAFIGPFEVGHLNASAGYRNFMQSYGEMFRTLAKDAKVDYHWDEKLIEAIHESLSRRTPVSDLPDRQAWRDRQLMALSKHLARAAG